GRAGGRLLLPDADERELRAPGDARGRGGGHPARDAPRALGRWCTGPAAGVGHDPARGPRRRRPAARRLRRRCGRVERHVLHRAAPRGHRSRAPQPADPWRDAADDLRRTIPGRPDRPSRGGDGLRPYAARPHPAVGARVVHRARDRRVRSQRLPRDAAPLLRGRPSPRRGRSAARTRARCRRDGGDRTLPNRRSRASAVARVGKPVMHFINRKGFPMARRVLVLTNEDLADANEVPESIRPLLDEAEDVYVVAPTLTTWMHWLTDDRDDALVAADERLRTVFAHMHAGGLKPHGEVGAENQVTAIADALAQFDADLMVLRLHAPGSEHENWREHGI